jgi:sulfate adenylyltransferase subunit 1 (EFTu-like GTPase family)
LRGDNVVTRSVLMPWYAGPSLVEYLESANPATAPEDEAGIFAVQWALRAPRTDPAYRGYAGRMVGGRLNAGDRVIVLPSREHARIAAIELGGEPLHAASAPRSVTLRLDGDVDVARGDIIAAIDADLRVTGAVDARICWMGERPLETGNRYLLRSLGFTTPCIVSAIAHRLDIETGARADARGRLERNDIGHLSLRLAAPIACQEYSRNRHTGSFILVDEVENTTVAAGMIVA